MSKIRRSLKRQTVTEKLTRARLIIDSLKTHPEFAAAAGVVAEFEAQTSQLAAASASHAVAQTNALAPPTDSIPPKKFSMVAMTTSPLSRNIWLAATKPRS